MGTEGVDRSIGKEAAGAVGKECSEIAKWCISSGAIVMSVVVTNLKPVPGLTFIPAVPATLALFFLTMLGYALRVVMKLPDMQLISDDVSRGRALMEMRKDLRYVMVIFGILILLAVIPFAAISTFSGPTTAPH